MRAYFIAENRWKRVQTGLGIPKEANGRATTMGANLRLEKTARKELGYYWLEQILSVSLMCASMLNEENIYAEKPNLTDFRCSF